MIRHAGVEVDRDQRAAPPAPADRAVADGVAHARRTVVPSTWSIPRYCTSRVSSQVAFDSSQQVPDQHPVRDIPSAMTHFESRSPGIQAARRRTSQTAAPISSTDSASSQPPSIHWNGQNRLTGW
jgi:hypothetical protein